VTELIMGYATFKDTAEADAICADLVKNKLIACANVFSPHKAIYEWDGKIENTAETAVVFKTKKELASAVVDFIKNKHSYQVPCVVTWKISDGHGDFLRWVDAQTT